MPTLPPSRRGLPLESVWFAVILAALGFVISLVPTPPNDFWWHLKIGELIFTTGRIPDSNLFAWTLPADAPFSYGAWLGEYLLFVVYRWGGVALVTFTRNVLLLTAFGLLGWEARRRSGSWRLAALVTAVAGAMALNNLIVRPQIWSFLPFMLFFLLLSRYADGALRPGWLLLLPLLMVFWVNAHGAFVLGLAMLAIFCLGETLRSGLHLPGSRGWRETAYLWGAAALTGLATLVNARFLAIFGYVFDLLTDKPSQRLIEEWQSPTPAGIANVVFYLGILALLALLVYSHYRPKLTELLLLGGFLWLAWSGQRYVIWFGWVLAPLLAQLVGGLPLRVKGFTPQKNWLNAALAALVFAPVALAQPWFVERLPLPAGYWAMVLRGAAPGPLLSAETPVAAVDYLRLHRGGKLFNEMGYGSYLIWALPDQGVFIDPRVELYPFEQWEDYVRIVRGARYNELLEKYGVERLLLDRSLEKELILALAGDPGWEMEYEDAHAQIWRKTR